MNRERRDCSRRAIRNILHDDERVHNSVAAVLCYRMRPRVNQATLLAIKSLGKSHPTTPFLAVLHAISVINIFRRVGYAFYTNFSEFPPRYSPWYNLVVAVIPLFSFITWK